MEIYWETLAAVGAATGSMELMKYAQEQEGGRINMCTALDNLVKESEREGVRKGIQKMILILKEFGIEDDAILQKLQEKFQLSYEEAKNYLDRATPTI